MLSFLIENTGIAISLVFILGLLVGSFLNVVILRLPPRLDWAWRQEAREILSMPEVLNQLVLPLNDQPAQNANIN